MAVDSIARGLAQKANSAIANLDVLKREIVDELPTTNISSQKIYMVPSQKPGDQNIYDEYFYVNGQWEHIGTTEINLENYVTFDSVKAGADINIINKDNILTISNTATTFRNFPDYVVTDGTMNDLIKSFEDNNVQTGEIYLGGITCTDMPKGLSNAELKAEVIKNSFGAKIYYFTIVSTNVEPYFWTGTGQGGIFNGWLARPTTDTLNAYVKIKDIKDSLDYESSAPISSKALLPIVKTTLNGTAQIGTIYDLGELETLNLNYPDTAKVGDEIIIEFISGDTPTVVSDGLEVSANTVYRLINTWGRVNKTNYGWRTRIESYSI